MNIKMLNNAMRKAFQQNGFMGDKCQIAVLDTAISEVGNIRGHITYMDSYRVDDKNVSDHGTFVANQILAWVPHAQILAYCVFPNGSGKSGMVNEALSDVLKRAKADKEQRYFVNMSLANNMGSNVITPYIARMHTLIKELVSENVSVFVASGNDGNEQLYIYPSRFNEPICVGSSDMFGNTSSFSTWHDELDAIDDGESVYGINRNGLPIFMSGTSMACPNLLGKAALLACRMADVTGQWPTESQLYEELKECAIDCETIGYDKKSGFGFVDIRNADGIFKVTDSVEKPQTWQAKLRESITVIRNLLKQNGFIPTDAVSDATYTKIIKLGSTGNDVKKVKDRLLELGYLHASTKYTFGVDSVAATKRFQKDNNLKVDGLVGILTWNKLFVGENTSNEVQNPTNPIDASFIPPNISRAKAEKIAADLAGVSEMRRNIVLHALQFAYDPDTRGQYPIGLYIRGGNHYNTDLSLNVMTPSKLERYFNNANYAPYYDGGREEMMRETCEQSGHTTSGSDCSGFDVGLLRFFQLVNSGFDANANTLFSKYCVATSNPLPADMLSKDGHAGLYAGGGFGIESVGGGYGIQLVPVAVRRVWSFMDHKLHKMSDWENFGRWKFLTN